MGVIPQHIIDELLRRDAADFKHAEKRTVVKLPCCGSMVEADKSLGDQYVTCPNRHCRKLAAGRPARHLVTWGMRQTTIRSEGARLEL